MILKRPPGRGHSAKHLFGFTWNGAKWMNSEPSNSPMNSGQDGAIFYVSTMPHSPGACHLCAIVEALLELVCGILDNHQDGNHVSS